MLRQWILTASVLTAAALILRLVFHKRISQRLQYALWLPVLLRLLLPFALFSAPVSVPAAAERLAPAVFAAPASRPETVLPTPYPSRPPAVSAAPIVPSGETAELRPAATPAPAEPVSSPVPARTLDWPRLLRFVWLDGSLVLALWLLGVNLGFWNKLRRSRTLFREGKTPVYVSESVASPCLFGLFRPAVYLTPEAAELPETQLEQVLLHERTHLRQGDPIWGLLRCLCLAVWWWNPLVWLAAACSRRDGELSCDEKVLRTLGEDKRLEYGHTLVDLLPRKTPGALLCTATISGGGRDMKERLERIVKKPRLWIAAAVIAVLLTALIVGCSFAGKGEEEPVSPSPSAAPTPSVTAAPTQTATPISNWQEQYRELVEKAMEADYPYVEWGNGPIQAMALMDLSGNGTPELALFFPGGGKSDAAVVVTVEEGELRCLNRDNPLGLPPSANAVGERAFNANPGKTAVQEDFPACFRYYCAADDRGNILEGFYLLDSGNGTSGERWCSWLVFGQDARGYLTCETRLTTDLAWDEDAEGTRETRWAINGQECTAEEYHAAEDAFLSWRDQYRYLAGTWERSCVVFRDEADPMAAVRRALAGWTPLPEYVPKAADNSDVPGPDLEPGSLPWLEWCLGTGDVRATIAGPITGEPSKTVTLDGNQCRSLLSGCDWDPYDGPATDYDSAEYAMTLQGPHAELLLTQGWPVALLRLEGVNDNQKQAYWAYAPMDYPGSNSSPADMLRWEAFDPTESNAATSAIRVDASEEDPALAYVLKLCEAIKNLSPGSSWGIQDYEVRGVASEEHKAQRELALHTIVYILPNEWNSVVWWAGAGMEPAAGNYEGWLIMDVYYLLELEDGAWRYKDSAQYNPGWGSLELDLDHVPEPEPTPEPAPEPTSEPTPAPTPEPAAYEPVTLEMWTDWLTLPKGARWLTREELDAWTAWFNADWMRWSFLTSAYARPQDVDLGALFYTGVDLRESSTRDYSQNAVTGKDLRYYLLHRGTFEHDIDLDKLPRVQMDDLLRKYLGIGLEETNKIGLWFPYFPETDAYYHLHGDTNWGPFPLRYGYVLGDEVCLFNQSTWNHGQFGATGYNNGGEGIYRTVLRKEGDSVRFVSNLRALTNGTDAAYDVPWQNDAYPDGYAEERDVTVITLIPEVYESAEAAREYVESLAFIVGDGNGGEAERYPIEILLEQDYPGYGTLIYGEIPTGTIHGTNPYLWFISTGGRLYRLPMPMGMANIRLERDGLYSADEGRGIRFLDSRSDMLRWWMRLTQEINQETNLYISSDSWTGGENKIVSSGSATWTLYLPTMEVFLLYEPEG